MNICEKCKYLNRDRKMCEFWIAPACAHNVCCGFSVETNADRIRAMSDEELATFINRCIGDNGPSFCRKLSECEEDLEQDTLIPLERCDGCLLDWLQQPAEATDA